MANNKQYWLTLEEKNSEMDINEQNVLNEVPVLGSIAETISTKKSGRRDFLKMLGFGVSAAAVAAACEMPVRKSIPYTIKPEEITPGMPNYYASSYIQGGHYDSVLVKTREGRPILLEGNSDSSISKGGINTKTLGALLSLYDEHSRFKNPIKKDAEISWEQLDNEVVEVLKTQNNSGKTIAILSSTILSPSTKKVIEAFSKSYENTKWVQFDAISYDAFLNANQANFGKRAMPNYHFDKASLIVSVGADFLGTWYSPVEYTSSYAKNREVSETKKTMSRHIQIESVPTLSGSNADLRIPVMPSEEVSALIVLYNEIASKMGSATVAFSSNQDYTKVKAVAKELLNAKGSAILVCGVNNQGVQELTNSINQMLGNYGSTITWDRSSYLKQGNAEDVKKIQADINEGKVGALLVLDCNPSYELGNAFNESLKKVPLKVDFSTRKTETSKVVDYIAPNTHFLESWDDAMPKDGIYATVQPTIAPLFNNRPAQESLLKWAGIEESYYDFIRKNWKTNVLPKQNTFNGFEALWSNAVHDGELSFNSNNTASYISVDAASSLSKINKVKLPKLELKIYEKTQIGDGTLSDNPWMQELPDPISRITWDDYFVANPKWVKDNNFKHNHKNREYIVAKATVNQKTITLPVVALPGVPYGCIGIAYGYGRTNTSHYEYERGENAYELLDESFNTVFEINSIEAVGKQKLAVVQQEHRLTHKGLTGEKTRKIVKETTLAAWSKNPASENNINFGKDWMDRKEWVDKYSNSLYGGGVEDSHLGKSKEYGGAHYKELSNGHHWGMAIDLNTCIGCSACVVACNVENNVPVVGRNEVRRAHDMQWLRIDKYHTGDEDNPQVIFQPMMCQHCDNAPCENVCPVSATNHSTEGLNQMTYNRCIGTRYCANNCPYKVRRFNWFDYQGADSFSANKGFAFDNDFDANRAQYGDKENGLGLHSPISKMVLNPDVTVRSRGVIEKCSFCVQRIQLGKLNAKKEGRALKDNEIKTACQSVCSTNAITFGDTNDENSDVSKMWANPRAYGVIEEIHTLPSVRYLVKVRNNSEEDIA